MTSKTDKLRAVFLTALMIGSVFAAGIAFTGGAAAQVDQEDLRKATHYVDSDDDSVLELAFTENVSDIDAGTDITLEFDGYDDVELDGGNTAVSTHGDYDERVTIDASAFGTANDEVNTSLTGVSINGSDAVDVTVAPETIDAADAEDRDAYVGTNVAIEGNISDTFEIESPDDDTTNRGSGNGSEVYVYDTDDLETGEYNITASNDNVGTLTLENLGLSAEASADSYTTADDVEVTVESNDIDRDVEAVLLDEDGDETDYTAEGTIDSDGQATLNFNQVDAEDVGNYTAEVTDIASGVTAETDEFEVTEEADDDSEFVTGTVENQRGDISTVNVSVTSNDQATVTIGEEDESGYEVNVTVTDDDGDGYAEFDVNTYVMGGNNNVNAETAGEAFIAGEDTVIDDIELVSDPLSEPIAADSYRMTVRAGADANASSQDVGRFIVNDASGVTSQNMWTAPAATDMDEVISEGPLSEDDSIADQDYVVHELEATGIEGVLRNASTENSTQAVLNAIDNGELSLTVEQTEASKQPNTDIKILDYATALQNDNAEVVADAENDTYYVVADLAAVDVTDADDDNREFVWGEDAYNATATLDADNTSLVSEDASASAEFSAEERTLEFNQDEYEVEAAEDQTFSGETSAATGTELTVRAESIESPGEGYILTDDDVTVEDGEWTATLDFSDASVNSTFELSADDPDGDSAGAEGSVVEAVEETTTEPADTTTEPADTTTEPADTTTEPADTTTEPADDTTEPADDTTTEDDGDGESGGGIPGFGVGIALVAILGAAFLALRQN
ncbi:BGTF surface domain-containing protein [Halobacterium yunchengense]|uniref:DUF7827 domain-containing protein n=1 Tax=Halobacterium yunchengense TaxID=3108497 RepID=UPI003009A8A5